jgi:nucleoid-associated protein YgaU
MGRGARGALALATVNLALTLSACVGGAGAPPTPTPPPTPAPLPTVPRPALDTPVAQASAGPADSAVHVVQSGETLGQIAMRYYGDANRWQAIYDANRGQLPSPNALSVGMRLTIPPASAASAAASPTPTPARR